MRQVMAPFLNALVLLLQMGGPSPNAAPIPIVTPCANSEACAVEGTLRLMSTTDASRTLEVPISKGRATVTQPIDSSWDVELRSDHYWTPRQALPARGADGTIRIPVWRSGVVTGRFTLAKAGAELPTSFRLSVASPPGQRGVTLPDGSAVECPIAADGLWRCSVPAGAVDAVLRVKGFTPHYKWDLAVKPDPPLSFGTVALQRGASLVAWLDSDTAKTLKEPARARLVRMVMAAPSAVTERLSQPVAEGTFHRRGAVQLAPLAPGTYSLEVTAPGYAPARIQPVEIHEASESVIRRPIALDPPVPIRVTIVPPRDPNGAPWQVSLYRSDDASLRRPQVGGGAVDDAGVYVVEGEGPGRYMVKVRDARGDVHASRELTSTGPAAAELTIEVGLLAVRGTLTLAKRPIAGGLVFGGRDGSERIGATANDEGAFAVRLPRAGKWRVDVDAASDGVLAAIDIDIAGNEDEIEIDLPDTEVAGWVFRSDGSRAGAVSVQVHTAAGVVARQSEADGSFRFRGVTPGTVMLSASDRRSGEQSGMTSVPLAAAGHVENLEIHLHSMRDLAGTVVSDRQPLIGALVTGYGYVDGSAHQKRAVSGLDGKFRLTFPTTASKIVLIVGAAGRALQVFPFGPTDEDVRLELPATGWTLRLMMPRQATSPRVSANGVDIPLPDLLQWARAHGQTPSPDNVFEIPALASGLYRFCATAPTSGGSTCREGTLARGAVLELSLR